MSPGAVGVVYLAGDDVPAVLADVLRGSGASRRRFDPEYFSCGSLRVACVVEQDGETIDQVVVSVHGSGAGTLARVCCHGGVRVVQRIVLRLEQCGAMSCPAEDIVSLAWHTTGAMDVEVISQLVQARTATAARYVLTQKQSHGLAGGMRQVGQVLSGRPDRASIESMLSDVARWLAVWRSARQLFEPARVVLAGPANAGKSTLCNALAGRSASLASEYSGTTRDWVGVSIQVSDVPFDMIDTAGLGDVEDVLHQQSAQRSRVQIASADVLAIVLDMSQPLDDQWATVADVVAEHGGRMILVCNKCDLSARWSREQLQHVCGDVPVVRTSASAGEGITELGHLLVTAVGLDDFDAAWAGAFSNTSEQWLLQLADDLRAGRVDAATGHIKRLLQ